MKATAKILCAICALTFSLITFTSCDDSIDDENFNLTGTWMHQDDDSREYYQFLSDGNGYEWEAPKANISDFEPRKEHFRYTISGRTITFIEDDGDVDVESLKLVNNNRIKIDGDTYDRQPN